MAFKKVNYVNNVTVITAENMNDMQDAILNAEAGTAIAKTAAIESQASANDAQAAATNAASAATEAQAAATNAASAATEAQAAATNAVTEAENAVNMAASAKQLTPEFANSVDECTDTTKLYVLPDGFIYAYMGRLGGVDYDNKLLSALALDGSGVFNGCGYKRDTRTSSSGDTAATGWCVTGLIPAKVGDVLRFKNMEYYDITGDGGSTPRTTFFFYNSSYTKLGNTSHNPDSPPSEAYAPVYGDNGDVIQLTVPSGISSSTAYIRLCCGDLNENSIITVNQEISDPEIVYGWYNTGHAFVPTDYEERINQLESQGTSHALRITNNASAIEQHAERLSTLENAQDGVTVPDYWLEHLSERTDDIRQAMEEAGRSKSAFLFYTDAHFSYNSKMSPVLLQYLHAHTPINKTIFGGDIVHSEPTELSDRETMEYLWAWRDAIRTLPNHHSVVGNHDDGNTTNHLFPDSYIYAYLMAAEECPEIVRGGDFYYYIDDACEKTRYLYLDTGYKCYSSNDAEQTAFVKEALKSTPSGWHIVAVSHIWVQMDYTVSPAVPGDFSTPAQNFLDIFDAYNARTGEYASCGGKVEFCIGGHTHIDIDRTTSGGIPVIITETDSRNIRSGLTYTIGTITESSVNAIVANYESNTISVIRVGRGDSRVVSY